MSKFFFDSGSGGNSEEDDNEDNLPYPEALLRSDFLSSEFDVGTYLSTLSDRHQTLDDLQLDLRERSQFLSKELLDLVNTNYEKFLGLGTDLKGGEERIENVRVGLLEFKSGVTDVHGKVKTRKDEIESLLREKITLRRQIVFGRNLLELDARLEELEHSLKVISRTSNLNDNSGHDIYVDSIHDENVKNKDTTDINDYALNSKLLHIVASKFCYIKNLMANIGTNHPFVLAQQFKMTEAKNKILMNLSKALHLSLIANGEEKYRLVELLNTYGEMGAADEAIRVLQEIRLKK